MSGKVEEVYQYSEEVSTEIDNHSKKGKLLVIPYNVIGKKKLTTDNAFIPNNYYGDEIITIKQMLNWIGYGKLRETAFFGYYTKKKVKQFQTCVPVMYNEITPKKPLKSCHIAVFLLTFPSLHIIMCNEKSRYDGNYLSKEQTNRHYVCLL